MREYLSRLLSFIEIILLIIFVMFIFIDYSNYNEFYSSPFYVNIIIRSIEFILPSGILFIINIFIKRGLNEESKIK